MPSSSAGGVWAGDQDGHADKRRPHGVHPAVPGGSATATATATAATGQPARRAGRCADLPVIVADRTFTIEVDGQPAFEYYARNGTFRGKNGDYRYRERGQ